MGIKFKNDAIGTLSGAIDNTQTSISLSAGQGDKFPPLPNSNDYMLVTIMHKVSAATYEKEVVKVTERMGDVLTVERGHSSDYPAKAFAAGDIVLLGFPAESLAAIAEIDSSPAPGTVSGRTFYLEADEDMSFGEIGYITIDFKIRKADADVASSLPGFYACAEPGGLTAGQKGKFLKEGTICSPAWNWTGGMVFLSLTTGELTQTAPDADNQYVQPIGLAIASNVIDFDPSLITIETKSAA